MYKELQRDYDAYMNGSNSPLKLESKSLTVEGAKALIELGNKLKPTFIADLGAGFSSIVLRKYFPDAFVITLDKEESWLEVVKEDCLRMGIEPYALKPLGSFLESPSMFNLIFADLGTKDNLDYFFRYFHKLQPFGYLVMNDWYEDEYRKSMTHNLGMVGFNYVKYNDPDGVNMAYAWR